MATALINFGALVAFTFVNLSVISQFWIREKRNKTLKDHFQYLFLPMCGALTVGALWVNPGRELDDSGPDLGRYRSGLPSLRDQKLPQPGAAVRRRGVRRSVM